MGFAAMLTYTQDVLGDVSLHCCIDFRLSRLWYMAQEFTKPDLPPGTVVILLGLAYNYAVLKSIVC